MFHLPRLDQGFDIHLHDLIYCLYLTRILQAMVPYLGSGQLDSHGRSLILTPSDVPTPSSGLGLEFDGELQPATFVCRGSMPIVGPYL